MSEFEKAKFIAIKYIGISKKTVFEVKNKLKQYEYSNVVIQKAIEYLIDLNYLNDREYVKLYIKQNINMEKYSVFEMKQKLKQKGIDVKNYNEEFNMLDEIEYNKKVYKKLFDIKIKNIDEIKVKQYLYRRGFDIRSE